MIPLVRSAHMTRIDKEAQESYALASTVLMENAGIKLFQKLQDLMPGQCAAGPMVFVAGKGNNGGDVLVMARQATGVGVPGVSVVYLSDELSGDPASHLAACRALDVPTYPWPSEEARTVLGAAGVIVDGVFGTGIKGALRGGAVELVEAMNASDATRVSVDVPSGVGDEFETGFPAVRAHATLTVELPKRCLYLPAARPFCGRISVVPIGFPRALLGPDPEESVRADWDDVRTVVAPLPEWSFKSSRGVVGVFAGAVGTSGAAILAAEACARSRAGLVHVYADAEIYEPLAASLTSVLVHRVEGDRVDASGSLADVLDSLDALLVGPGWGRAPGRLAALRDLARSGLPGVLDADGLNVAAEARKSGSDVEFAATWVLTPHPGECARLAEVDTGTVLADPVPVCRDLARSMNAVVVMKSHVTYVVPPDGRPIVVDGMNAALGTGGSGDVLSGIIGALLSHGSDATDAAVGGVLLHAESGRRCRAESGWFLAEDLPRVTGRLFEEIGR